MSKYIYWKLQTKANQDILNPNSEEFNRFKEKFGRVFNKENETSYFKQDQDIIELYGRIAYKNPMFSKIHSLSIGYVNKEEIRIIRYTGEEKDLIQTFLNTLNNDHFKDYTLVQYDSEVILPYFGVRANMNNIKDSSFNKGLLYKGLRPWDLKSVDLRHLFNGAGAYSFNLKDMCFINNITADFMDYTMENKASEEDLKVSAKEELKAIINNHRIIKDLSVVDTVVFSEQIVEQVKEEETPHILLRLYRASEIPTDVENYIKKATKKATKKDKVVLEHILSQLYINNKMFASDKEQVKIDKKEEIKSLLYNEQ